MITEEELKRIEGGVPPVFVLDDNYNLKPIDLILEIRELRAQLKQYERFFPLFDPNLEEYQKEIVFNEIQNELFKTDEDRDIDNMPKEERLKIIMSLQGSGWDDGRGCG